ncbi:hypothetical protein [Brachybacterium hainanense]|uniref:Uncharacterized protein n=1 Tax=Brachybacterium hainanense TaxID=1541174 RepID=A0ABV6RCA7_9MICO
MDSPIPPRTPSAPDPRTRHRHGRWTFCLDGDEISEIARDGVELLESLRPALRDPEWGVMVPRILAETLDAAPGEADEDPPLVRTLEVRYDGPAGPARATGQLCVTEDELRLRWTLDAEAALLIARAGLTVGLPREVAGEDAVVTTVDGHRRPHRFPERISPWQPLFGIRALDLDRAGVRVRLMLLGDEFEMEDRRNWTEAGFTIYSRPLERPVPYRIDAGGQVVQEVVLRASAEAAAPGPAAGASASAGARDLAALLDGAEAACLPSIGLGATTAAEVPAAPLPRLAGIDHLLVEVSERDDVPRVLEAALAESRALDVPVDLRLVGGPDLDVAGVLAQAQEAGILVMRAAVFDETLRITVPELHAQLLAAAAPDGIEVAAGARTHFAELNRQVHRVPEAALLAVPSTPLTHGTGSWRTARSLGALGDVLASARALRPGARLLLGPVTPRPGGNAGATEAELGDRSDREGRGAPPTPGADDPRLATDWAAAWIAGVLAEAAVAGVEDVSLLEVAGPRGIVREDGALTPAGELIARLAPLHGRAVRAVRGPGGPGTALLAVEGLTVLANAGGAPWAVLTEDGEELLLAPGTVRLLS